MGTKFQVDINNLGSRDVSAVGFHPLHNLGYYLCHGEPLFRSCFLEQVFKLGHRDFVSSKDVCWRPGKKVFMTEF
jgi:hypothetical protein